MKKLVDFLDSYEYSFNNTENEARDFLRFFEDELKMEQVKCTHHNLHIDPELSRYHGNIGTLTLK